ncbi:GA-like domain-containing protein, partial [Enterococcus sp. 5B3_DIV0040]|uniref:GA-like domain-containing protein n=1 Tax=Enterococcus sp. 5B3_DIV0040 TaxID=1834182 RepID=UPI001593D19A
EAAEVAVEAAEAASQAGVTKKTEVVADGLVSVADKTAVDELNEVTEAKTLNASMLEFPKTGSVDNSILKVTWGVFLLGAVGLLGYKKRREIE